MATPQSTADEDTGKNLEQITFRFCLECSNMLYPKEDEESHKLQFTCRTCQYTEEATSTCVFRNVMNNAVGETAGVTQDVGSDPTVRNDAPPPAFSVVPQAGSVGESREPANASTHVAEIAQPDALACDPALCMRCGFTLLHCQKCTRPASVEQYNELVLSDPDFAASRTMDFMRVANFYHCLPAHEQAEWDGKFVSCNIPHLSGLMPESLAQYLPMEIASNPDADPPEALGVEAEYDYMDGDFAPYD